MYGMYVGLCRCLTLPNLNLILENEKGKRHLAETWLGYISNQKINSGMCIQKQIFRINEE